MAEFREFEIHYRPDWLDGIARLHALDKRLRTGELTGKDLTDTDWGKTQSRKTWQRMMQCLAGLGAPIEYRQLPAGVIYRYRHKRWSLAMALESTEPQS